MDWIQTNRWFQNDDGIPRSSSPSCMDKLVGLHATHQGNSFVYAPRGDRRARHETASVSRSSESRCHARNWRSHNAPWKLEWVRIKSIFFYLWSFGVSEPILTPVAVTAAAGSLDVRRLSGWWKRVVFPDVALGSHCSHHSCMRSQWTWFSCHLNKNTVIFFTREEYLSW